MTSPVLSRRFLGLVATIVGLAGCASAPIPVSANFEASTQKKVRSVGHWDLIAKDVVSQTVALIGKDGTRPGQAFYVRSPDSASEFDQVFRELLTTTLVRQGYVVQLSPGPTTTDLTYNTQLIVHNSPRPKVIPLGLTALTAGLFVMHAVSLEHVDVQRAATLGLAGLMDWGFSEGSGGPTSTELILTTSVSGGGRFLARKSDIYYLEGADATLFARARIAPVVTSRTMQVVAK